MDTRTIDRNNRRMDAIGALSLRPPTDRPLTDRPNRFQDAETWIHATTLVFLFLVATGRVFLYPWTSFLAPVGEDPGSFLTRGNPKPFDQGQKDSLDSCFAPGREICVDFQTGSQIRVQKRVTLFLDSNFAPGRKIPGKLPNRERVN